MLDLGELTLDISASPLLDLVIFRDNASGVVVEEFTKLVDITSAVFGGDVNIGIPLFFLVKVEFLLLELSTLSNKFSCDDVTEDCLDLGMVNMVLGLVPELMFKLLLELEFDNSARSY